ncbi:uncharacterized protein LOC125198208 [Salvia hispanica]|uniref:uncharacterized protein LOC125198208 n=1 Tax=Salvia hispanica TaxID=49212 RepID=UPI002008FFFE|nr:uncharacterized protein LOC125198208 [Salvia hispanica]
MSDWGPVFVAVVLFVLLSPGLLIQVPGRNRFVEFGNFQTSGVSILVHALIYFALICIFLLAIGIHVYMAIVKQLIRQCEGRILRESLTFFLKINSIYSSTILEPFCSTISFFAAKKSEGTTMADWGPVLVGVVLFVFLQPGLLFQLPGNNKQIEFGSTKTNGKAIMLHTLIFFAFYALLILAVHVHIYTG